MRPRSLCTRKSQQAATNPEHIEMKEQSIKAKHATMPNKQAAYKPERKIYLYSWIRAPADRDNEGSL